MRATHDEWQVPLVKCDVVMGKHNSRWWPVQWVNDADLTESERLFLHVATATHFKLAYGGKRCPALLLAATLSLFCRIGKTIYH